MIYEFKVTLKEMPVPVWRKVQIESGSTFYDLHKVIQITFGWYDYHLHSFLVNKSNGQHVEYINIELENDFDDFGPVSGSRTKKYNEAEEKLSNWFKLAKDKVNYTYDFGDDWEHEIVLTKILKPEKGVLYPRCIAAKNDAPEEDSGFEMISGEVELERDNEDLLAEIDENMALAFADVLSEGADDENNIWPELLQTAKEFQKRKPWELMDDEHIFAVEHPETNELLFCSVMGGLGEYFGLGVYYGKEGYQTVIDSVEQKKSYFEVLMYQRSVAVNFEDRDDLDKEDYALIKSYDIPFRGKKAWPAFRSYKPGLYPWLMDDDEAKTLLLGLKATLEVYEELRAGSAEIVDMYEEVKIYTKIPREVSGEIVFDSRITDLVGYENNKKDIPLGISEIGLRRAKKLKTIPASVEFIFVYVDMPIQNGPDERPFFPLFAFAVDYERELIIYQNIMEGRKDPETVQGELLRLFQTLDGIPEHLLIDEELVEDLSPVIDTLNLSIQTEDYQSIALQLLEEVLDNIH